jgi:hypothetical protein
MTNNFFISSLSSRLSSLSVTETLSSVSLRLYVPGAKVLSSKLRSVALA